MRPIYLSPSRRDNREPSLLHSTDLPFFSASSGTSAVRRRRTEKPRRLLKGKKVFCCRARRLSASARPRYTCRTGMRARARARKYSPFLVCLSNRSQITRCPLALVRFLNASTLKSARNAIHVKSHNHQNDLPSRAIYGFYSAAIDARNRRIKAGTPCSLSSRHH